MNYPLLVPSGEYLPHNLSIVPSEGGGSSFTKSDDSISNIFILNQTNYEK